MIFNLLILSFNAKHLGKKFNNIDWWEVIVVKNYKLTICVSYLYCTWVSIFS